MKDLNYENKNQEMNIIRDEDFKGLMMIPLLIQWNVDRCNVKDCKENPTTIITGVIKCSFGLCEKHYNKFKEKGKLECTLDFSNN